MSQSSALVESYFFADDDEIDAQIAFLNRIQNLNSLRLLEIGAGFGELAFKIQNEVEKIFIVESDLCKQVWLTRFLANSDFQNIEIIHNLSSNEFNAKQIDFVYSFNTFSYLTDLELTKIINKIYASLAPGGYLVFNHLQPHVGRDLNPNTEVFYHKLKNVQIEQKIQVLNAEKDFIELSYENSIIQNSDNFNINYIKRIFPRRLKDILQLEPIKKCTIANSYKNLIFDKYTDEDSSFILILQK